MDEWRFVVVVVVWNVIVCTGGEWIYLHHHANARVICLEMALVSLKGGLPGGWPLLTSVIVNPAMSCSHARDESVV
jgi:hypothetical protein